MRRKIIASAMANDEPDKATTSTSSSPDQQQNDEVAHSAKRLYRSANHIAQKLVGIIHLRGSDAHTTKDVVQRCYALAGTLSSLLEDLMRESVTGGADHKDMWTKNHHQALLRCMEKCSDFFAAIGHAVRIADEQFHGTGVNKGKNYLDGLSIDNEYQALVTLDECFHLVSQTTVIAKHTALARVENL